MKIYAPVENASGVWASVRFVNGVGETDNPRLLQWFQAHGYRLDTSDSRVVNQPVEDYKQRVGVNVDLMTDTELREWMISAGLGKQVKSTRDRNKLLKILDNNRDLLEV